MSFVLCFVSFTRSEVCTSRKASVLFDSPEEEMEYLEERDLDEHITVRLEMLCRYQEAAELHLENGRMSDAIRLFLLDEDTESQSKGVDCLIKACWNEISLGVSLESLSPSLQELLNISHALKNVDQLEASQRDEVSLNLHLVNLCVEQISSYCYSDLLRQRM